MNTGELIKTARKKTGLTQKELGLKLGVAYQTIAQWENGLRNPKIDTIKRIASALGVPFLELISPQEAAAYNSGFWEGVDAEALNDRAIDQLWKEEGYCFSDTECELINAFSTLNDVGQQKAVDAVKIIAGNPEFKRNNPPPASDETVEVDWWTQDPPQSPP